MRLLFFFFFFAGRSTQLIPYLCGVLTNPNCEFESNFVAMHTIATWWKSYKPAAGDKSPTCDAGNFVYLIGSCSPIVELIN